MNGPTIIAVMVAGYLLVMGALWTGLAGRPPGARPRPGAPWDGWPGLIRQVVGTAVGGYLLLMAVVLAYYHGVAGLGESFLINAFTGAALLVAMSLPSFLAASWLAERRRRRRRVGRRDAAR